MSERQKRADIEGMRALAILLVILFHAHVPFVSGGFVGVDVFFALSGYLITGLMAAEHRRSGTVVIWEFYARRARRLLPAAWTTILATLVLSWWVLGPLDQQSFSGAAVASTMYLGNVWFGLNATDYLAAPPDNNPFLHLWSLAVEEQFYLVWPILFVVLMRIAPRRVRPILLGLSVLSLGLTLALQAGGWPHWAFFASPPRAWEFGLGAAAALGGWRLPWWCSWLGLVAVVIPAVTYGPLTPFPGLAALPPVLGTVAILVARDPTVERGLSWGPFQYIGGLSYGWYLWHWPLLVVARTLVPGLDVWANLAISIVALGLAQVSLLLIEGPIRHSGWLAHRPRVSVVGAVAVTCLVLFACQVWRSGIAAGLRTPEQVRFSQARDEMPAIYAAGCHLDVGTSRIRDCAYGAQGSETTIVLWGDSHAAQWFPALEGAASRSGWRLVPITKSGCPPADLGGPVSCREWRREAIAEIRRRKPSLVVLANAYVYLEHADARALRSTPDQFVAGARRTLEALKGIPTAVVLPLRRPGFDVPMCLARRDWRPWPFTRCELTSLRPSTMELEQSAARGLSDVHVVDFSESVCPADTCAPIVQGEIAYRDDNHLTPRFSRRLAPFVAQALSPLVLQAPTRGHE